MRKSTENTLRLKVITDEQHGYFTAAQARLAGYASQQHVFHCDSGKWIRVKRGVFRLHGYSDSNESELAKWCLICHDTRSRPMATVSHESALLFHGLLDTPPKLPTLTVPSGFVKRIPDGCDLRRGILREDETVTKGAIKVTNPLRTLKDMKEFVDAETLKNLASKALERGIVTYADLADAGLREGVAPSASNGSGHTLALLVMRSEGDFHGELRRHMTDFLQSSGIVSALVDPKKGGEPLIIQFERALRLKPSYLAIGGETLTDAQWRSYLTERQASLPPIVFLNTAERQFHVSASYIQIDYWRGAYEATRWLILQGRKRIVLHAPTWVYSPESYRNSVSYDFSQGWSMALEEAGMPPGKKFFDSSDDADNERRFLELITSPDRPDAILAEADFRICRRIGTIRKAGLRIPDELMLVGCYNTSLSTHPDCPFPSISLREEEMARIAADIMSVRQSTNLIKTVIPELIVRGVEGSV